MNVADERVVKVIPWYHRLYTSKSTDAAPSLNEFIIELLQEVIDDHSDPDEPGYNECEKPGEMCQWCEEAKYAIKSLNP